MISFKWLREMWADERFRRRKRAVSVPLAPPPWLTYTDFDVHGELMQNDATDFWLSETVTDWLHGNCDGLWRCQLRKTDKSKRTFFLDFSRDSDAVKYKLACFELPIHRVQMEFGYADT